MNLAVDVIRGYWAGKLVFAGTALIWLASIRGKMFKFWRQRELHAKELPFVSVHREQAG